MPDQIQSNDLKTAQYLATLAHAGQVDKAGRPYIEHLQAVADGCSGRAKVVAWLHDLLEDSGVDKETFGQMLAHFMPDHIEVFRAVCAITKIQGEDYSAYIERVKVNPLAREVKIADLKHNMDLSRLLSVTEKDLARVEKYEMALSILEDERRST